MDPPASLPVCAESFLPENDQLIIFIRVLVGEPGFYGHFGFRNRPECTMDDVPREFFLSLTLGEHSVTGKVKHHAAFSARG
jgi:predicted N-acetyltransferase YhbS